MVSIAKKLVDTPFTLLSNHGVQNCNEFSHASCYSHFRVFAVSFKPLVNRFDGWVAKSCAQCSHKEGCSNVCTPSNNAPLP